MNAVELPKVFEDIVWEALASTRNREFEMWRAEFMVRRELDGWREIEQRTKRPGFEKIYEEASALVKYLERLLWMLRTGERC